MVQLIFMLILTFSSQGWADAEIQDTKTEGDFCAYCNHAKPIVHSPAALPHVELSGVVNPYPCGARCEALLAAAKEEGMRCPHKWADFKRIKLGAFRSADACEWYRAHGKDPTQWSKGLCATAAYDDFGKAGIPVTKQAGAHSWAEMLEDPKLHMKKVDITDPADAPRGAVLVYSSYGGKGYGHIEVAMGDEFCSDYCYPVNFLVKAPGENGKLLGAYIPQDG